MIKKGDTLRVNENIIYDAVTLRRNLKNFQYLKTIKSANDWDNNVTILPEYITDNMLESKVIIKDIFEVPTSTHQKSYGFSGQTMLELKNISGNGETMYTNVKNIQCEKIIRSDLHLGKYGAFVLLLGNYQKYLDSLRSAGVISNFEDSDPIYKLYLINYTDYHNLDEFEKRKSYEKYRTQFKEHFALYNDSSQTYIFNTLGSIGEYNFDEKGFSFEFEQNSYQSTEIKENSLYSNLNISYGHNNKRGSVDSYYIKEDTWPRDSKMYYVIFNNLGSRYFLSMDEDKAAIFVKSLAGDRKINIKIHTKANPKASNNSIYLNVIKIEVLNKKGEVIGEI